MVLYNELFNIGTLTIHISLYFCHLHRNRYIFQQLLINNCAFFQNTGTDHHRANPKIIKGIETSKLLDKFSFQQVTL
jgi:hypothetical protein